MARVGNRTIGGERTAEQSAELPRRLPARLVLGVVCDQCGVGYSLTVADPDRSGAGWAAPPDRRRNGCGADWRVMAVPGDGSEALLSASWERAGVARFPTGSNPFRDDREVELEAAMST